LYDFPYFPIKFNLHLFKKIVPACYGMGMEFQGSPREIRPVSSTQPIRDNLARVGSAVECAKSNAIHLSFGDVFYMFFATH
jgi:hypothetical protein